MALSDFGWVGALLPAGVGIFAGSLVALWLGRQRGVPALAAFWIETGASLLAARAAFVLGHFANYRASPVSILDIGDGGFAATAGLFTAFVTGAELVRRVPARRRALLAASVAGIAAWVAAVVATLNFAPASTAVPSAEVRTMRGAPIRLQAVDGKPMVVNLWASWCPPCRREMPVLQAAQKRHPDITFVFVNEGEPPQAIESFLASERLDLANLYSDPRGEFASQAQAFAFPTTLFFDSRGRLLMRQVGGLTEPALASRLAMLRVASPAATGAPPR